MYDNQMKLRSMAHDINGLMARVMLVGKQLEQHQDEKVAARAGKICSAIDLVSEICRRELDPLRDATDLVDMGASRIEQLLWNVANMVAAESALGPEPIDYYIRVDNDVSIQTDPQSLFRILFNLTLNAANALVHHGGTSIRLSARHTAGRVSLSVCDDGPGLPKHVLNYLYPSPVHKPCGRSGRIGSGLITAAALASELSGDLILSQSNSAGTIFRISLPVRRMETFSVDLPVIAATAKSAVAKFA